MTQRVVWVTPGYPWDGEPIGGIFFQTQARAVARHGTAVTVACPTPWAPWPLPLLGARWRRYALAPRIALDGTIRILRPRYPAVLGQPSRALPDRFMARAMWQARSEWSTAQLIHGHDVVTGLAAWRLARRAGLPFVLTFHGDDMNTWPEAHPERLGELRSAVRDATEVFTVSRALSARVETITGVEATPLPLGVDVSRASGTMAPREVERRDLGFPDGKIVAAFVGYLLRSKGVRELVEAILDLGEPFHLVLVGDGPEAGFGLDDPRAGGRLDYRGRRLNHEALRVMRAADVVVLPSHGEGMPTVLVEAGLVGTPIIASRVGGIPELLAENRGTLLPDTSPRAIAQALRSFAANRESATAAAERLRQHVLESYDADHNAEELVRRYAGAIRRVARPVA